MQTLTERLIELSLGNRYLTEAQLHRVVGGSAARRYGLVNRALKAGELIRIRRGLYVLADRYRTEPPHPFAVAQALEPGSYVSFETALSHHGWIPEAVKVTASVVPGRKSSAYEHPLFGSYTFHPLALQPGRFLELVQRVQLAQQTMLVAKPIRALMDLVCLRKVEWQGIGWLIDGLRIDYDALGSVPAAELKTLDSVYKQSRVRAFLRSLVQELEKHD